MGDENNTEPVLPTGEGQSPPYMTPNSAITTVINPTKGKKCNILTIVGEIMMEKLRFSRKYLTVRELNPLDMVEFRHCWQHCY